ncbi:MAG: sigma-70 family RNA polymerase sigma factor [Alphaproteobacteria bacterium]|nr:sigma-70 family RNA polymerase sigma factor [Alphaproteobacteria bacterium]
MAPSEPTEVTRLLQAMQHGDRDAGRQLLPLVYDELHRIAARHMRRERPDHTLQPTALIHEAWLRLAPGDDGFTDRAHFLGIAARVMRQVLVDHARAVHATKRGGDLQRVTMDEALLGTGAPPAELLDLDRALDGLAAQDARAARVAELRLFGGLTVGEIATTLEVSQRTVDDDWAVARMWLRRALQGDG